ncbi:hypothetical protein LINPERHAP1_LOCUS33956 [Linum perenne]
MISNPNIDNKKHNTSKHVAIHTNTHYYTRSLFRATRK